MKPISIVDSKQFRKFVQVLHPRYEIPSKRYFTEKVIPDLYEEAKANVISELSGAASVALTTDSWTSRACESYITITAHFINRNWNLRNFVLQIRLLEESHTGVNIGAVLREALTEWNLNFPYPVPLVTDNASNMSIAAETAGLSPI